MFTQKSEPFGAFEKITLSDVVSGNAFTFLPAFGGNLIGLNLNHTPVIDGFLVPENIYNDNFYKSAFLYPYPNRIRNGNYEFENQRHQLTVNEATINTALHGFLFWQNLKIEEIVLEDDMAKAVLSFDYVGNQPGYPFQSSVKISYIIDNVKGFSTDIEIVNKGETNAPVGFGWHPYFMLWNRVDNLEMKIPSVTKFDFDDQMIPNGISHSFDRFQEFESLSHVFFDHCFKIESENEIVETQLRNPEKKETITFWQDNGNSKFGYLQIFTPPHRKSIAIEPMTCSVDAFNNGDGLIKLKPNESFRGSFGLKIDKEA